MSRDSASKSDFAAIALPLMDQVYTTALHLTRSRHEADDLLQDTYLRAYRFWSQFTPGTNCKAWLLTILHNAFRNRYRERQRDLRTLEFDDAAFAPGSAAGVGEGVGGDPEERVLASLLDAEVESALGHLPPDFLDVIVLVDVQELTYEEAAEAIGCPIGTVRSRLSRGRSLLHDLLRDYARQRGLVKRDPA
jgi:RNA polymerase sigma-70 factor (ECF subfamily)